MFARIQLFNGGTGEIHDLVGRAAISFPWAEDEEGNVIKVMLYRPGEWLNVWERGYLIDGKPHKVRLSIMEDYKDGNSQEAPISGSGAPGSSGLQSADFPNEGGTTAL